jgi:hypothetical protein
LRNPVLAEDPDLVLGTNLLQYFRKTYWVSSKLVSYRPEDPDLVLGKILAKDPEGVLEMGLDVRFPAFLSHDEHKVTKVQGSRPVICTTGTEHCSPLYIHSKEEINAKILLY